MHLARAGAAALHGRLNDRACVSWCNALYRRVTGILGYAAEPLRQLVSSMEDYTTFCNILHEYTKARAGRRLGQSPTPRGSNV